MSSMRSASSSTSTLHVVERDEAAVDEILQPAGRRDDHVRVLRLVGLRLQRHAAVDRRDLDARRRRSARTPRSPARRARASARARARRAAPGRVERSTIGIANASVLPEPVGLLARTSPPRSASGITSAWIWNGVSMPRAASTSAHGLGHPEGTKISHLSQLLRTSRSRVRKKETRSHGSAAHPRSVSPR